MIDWGSKQTRRHSCQGLPESCARWTTLLLFLFAEVFDNPHHIGLGDIAGSSLLLVFHYKLLAPLLLVATQSFPEELAHGSNLCLSQAFSRYYSIAPCRPRMLIKEAKSRI